MLSDVDAVFGIVGCDFLSLAARWAFYCVVTECYAKRNRLCGVLRHYLFRVFRIVPMEKSHLNVIKSTRYLNVPYVP